MATTLFLIAFVIFIPFVIVGALVVFCFATDPVGMVREAKKKKQEYKEAWEILKNKE